MKSVRIAVIAFAVLASAPAAAETLIPSAAGTIRSMPEAGLFEVAPVGSDVQSNYARTNELNREFRRGIAEFAIPSIPILGATIVLVETRGTTAYPLPPDLHHLTAYDSADLAVTTDDYDRAGIEVATFETDQNEAGQTFTWDVTSLAVAAAGGTLGFRVQLDADPGQTGFLPLGSTFDVSLVVVSQPTPVSQRSWGAVKKTYR